MKMRKSTIKWLVWVLAFFLATAGLAEGAERCKGKCCQVPQKSVDPERSGTHEPAVPEIPLQPGTPMGQFLPSCHGPSGDKRVAVAEREPCPDEGPTTCCHLGKVQDKVQALAVQGHFLGTDRLSHAVSVATVQPDPWLNQNQLNVNGWRTLLSRAAPVPIYLKNASFIC